MEPHGKSLALPVGQEHGKSLALPAGQEHGNPIALPLAQRGEVDPIELERCLRDPIRHMFLLPEVLQPDGSTYAAHMMRQCVRILERYMGPDALYDTRLVRRILGLLQQNEPRNRGARLWALCFFMCHYPPIRSFIESLTEDKQRLADLMTVMPTWIECQQDWHYTVNNVHNMLTKFLVIDLVSVYLIGPPKGMAPPIPIPSGPFGGRAPSIRTPSGAGAGPGQGGRIKK